MGRKKKVASEPVSPQVFWTVSSPEDLAARLRTMDRSQRGGVLRYISAALNDDKVLARLFDFRQTTPRELAGDLLNDAADLLSLAPEEVDLDYQILNREGEHLQGVYLCAPKALIRSYLAQLDASGRIPMRLTSPLIANINLFLSQHKKVEGVSCLLDLSQAQVIYCAVLDGPRCLFLRKVRYEDPGEMRHVVIQTLRGACAQSPTKGFDRIFLIGDPQQRQGMESEIHKEFSVAVEHPNLEAEQGYFLSEAFSRVNLLRAYVFSPRTRWAILVLTGAALWLLVMQAAFLGIEIRYKDIMLDIQTLSLDPQQVLYAQQLQGRLK